jgi:hypothetical protein
MLTPVLERRKGRLGGGGDGFGPEEFVRNLYESFFPKGRAITPFAMTNDAVVDSVNV